MATGLFLGFQLTIGAVGVAMAAPDPEHPVAIAVTVGQGALTVDVRDTPLAQVLQIIGELSGVGVTLHGDLSAPVTQAFAGLPLEEGIRRLARDHSVIVTYGSPVGESGQSTVTGVWVMGRPAPRAGAASESWPSTVDSAPGSAKEVQPDVSVADGARESSIAHQIGEVQRLADDADRGSVAAMARLAEIGGADADAAIRQQAVAALGRLTTAAVEPVLAAALADTDADVRLRAVRGLRRLGTDTSVQSIAQASLADGDPQVRLAAVTALTSLPGDAMRRALAQASSDADEAVRGVAIRGLAWWNARGPSGP